MDSRYFIGVDLGQRWDPTAIAVVERAELAGEWSAVWYAYRKVVQYRVRHLERLRLGTPYPEVVARVRQVARLAELAERSTMVVDGTGVGAPVVDLLWRAGLGCTMIPVMITGGELERYDKGYRMVPKRDLVEGLVLRMEQGQLKIAQGMKEGEQLLREMAGMRVKATGAGRERYGAWRSGEHDDLVLAVALACWGGKQRYPVDGPEWIARDGVKAWEREIRGAVRRLV